MGKVYLPSLDPFVDINPLTELQTMTSIGQRIVYEKELASVGLLIGGDGTSRSDDSYDDEWINEGEDLHYARNVFDIFIDKDEDM